MNRRLVILGVAAVAVVALLARTLMRDDTISTVQGYAEAEYVKVAPVQAGLLTAVSVRRGDQVKAGQKLFSQDDQGDRAARDEAARRLEQARFTLADLEKGGRPSEIAAAQADVNEATAARDRAQTDLVRGEALLKEGFDTRQHVDQLRAEARSTVARLNAASAKLETVRLAARIDAIEAQRSAVKAAEATLAEAEWRLAQRDVLAPADALVADTLARPGEHVEAGYPVVSLLPPPNLLIRFFVPETELARVRVGDAVDLSCHNCPAGLQAAVSFVAPQPEYTPPVIYSEAIRAKLVFLVEARPRGDAVTLKPGQPIDVKLPRPVQ
jgi:HlyD family secretion protein